MILLAFFVVVVVVVLFLGLRLDQIKRFDENLRGSVAAGASFN